jgi:hypothetical protein
VGAFDEDELGVYSSTLVMEDGQPIFLVVHDEDDDWQFLASHEEHADECVLLHLSHVLEWDASLRTLESLPRGWRAWRWKVGDEWVREPTPPDHPEV